MDSRVMRRCRAESRLGLRCDALEGHNGGHAAMVRWSTDYRRGDEVRARAVEAERFQLDKLERER